MKDIPVIVISSSEKGVGKTTIALNLSAALWADDYKVAILSTDSIYENFIKQRELLNKKNRLKLPFPQIISDIKTAKDIDVIVADIPSEKNEEYAEIFSSAHTLITVISNQEKDSWLSGSSYINLIWDAKKNIAAKGIKYLNWIVVPNLLNMDDTSSLKNIETNAKKYGYRIASPIKKRASYQYINNGFCSADMTSSPYFKMTMSDVYARREILTLTDFLWQHK